MLIFNHYLIFTYIILSILLIDKIFIKKIDKKYKFFIITLLILIHIILLILEFNNMLIIKY